MLSFLMQCLIAYIYGNNHYNRYSCEDHFLELDTFLHSEQTLALLLKDETLTKDILCDIGIM